MTRLQGRTKIVGTRPATIVNRWISRIEGDLLRLVGLRIAKSTKYRIRSSKRSPEGDRWPARKDNLPHPLLNRKGIMLGAVKSRRVDRRTVAVNSEVPYAKFQNARRRFLGVSTVDIDDVEGSVIRPWVGRNLK